MMKEDDYLKVRAHAAPWYNGVEFLIMQGKAYGTHVVMKTRTPAEEGYQLEPTFRLEMAEAQLLIDDLWNAGLRPTEGHGSAGAFAAVKNHLEDMRALVFSTPRKG